MSKAISWDKACRWLEGLALLNANRLSAVRASGAVMIPVGLKGGNNFTTVRIGDVDLKTIVDTGGWKADSARLPYPFLV